MSKVVRFGCCSPRRCYLLPPQPRLGQFISAGAAAAAEQLLL